MAKKTAAEWTESLTAAAESMGQKIADAARDEVLTYKTRALRDELLDTTGRATFGGKTPDACIVETLAQYPACTASPRLQAALARFEQSGVTEDCRVGLLLALTLMADKDFDY